MEIRRIRIGEASVYREVRLAALLESPSCFLSTHEAALQRTEESWASQADGAAEGSDRAIFLALDGQGIAHAIAALYRDTEEAAKYTGEMIQVWVNPSHRGEGVADRLIAELFAWAAQNDFRVIRAEVKSDNTRALRFYEKYGFIAEASPEPGRDIPISMSVPSLSSAG